MKKFLCLIIAAFILLLSVSVAAAEAPAESKTPEYTRGKKLEKDFDRILNQGWLHAENIKEGLKNED